MLKRGNAVALALALGLVIAAGDVFAQRAPPSSPQGTPQLSLERAWNWLIARPGVIIALVIIVAAISYMIVTRRRSRT